MEKGSEGEKNAAARKTTWHRRHFTTSLLMDDVIGKAAEAIREADAVVVTAGAGFGVDSGLPDFRGTEGFWRSYPIAERLGLQFHELSNPRWFDEQPRLAWAFFGHRYQLYSSKEPHEGYHIARELMQAKTTDGFVFTSNVDGHFRRAGFPEDAIVECHGSLAFTQCVQPCSEAISAAEGLDAIEIDMETFEAREATLPRCGSCARLARPNVLMFGDGRWNEGRTAAQEARWEAYMSRMQRDGKRLVVIEAGAGLAVPTVRLTSEQIVRCGSHADNFLVRINPREPQLPRGVRGVAIADSALAVLRRIKALL